MSDVNIVKKYFLLISGILSFCLGRRFIENFFIKYLVKCT